ncbi:MAG: hypothetical protein EAZ95_12450 [Bacteroidetes bacterium]|nr:MAG: hypothetical protein EAZ95_12450 [Bacteroidota bacterium]
MFLKHHIFFSFFLSIFITIPVFAQTKWMGGYIVSLEKDTIRGQIANTWLAGPTTNITFKDASGVEKEYTPENTTAFGFNDGYDAFLSISCELEINEKKGLQIASPDGKINKQISKIFARKVLTGELSFYEYSDINRIYYFIQQEGKEPEYLSYNVYYVLNRNGVKFLYYNTQYRTRLKEILSKAPIASAKASNVAYKQSELLSLIKAYYKETGQKYKQGIKPNPLHIGITGGISFNKIKFLGPSENEIYSADFGVSTVPMIGLSFEKYLSRRKNLSLYGELALTGFNARNTNTIMSKGDIQSGTIPSLVRVWDFNLKIRHLDMKTLFRYTLAGENFNPFIHIGVNYGLSLHPEQLGKFTRGRSVVETPFTIRNKLGFIAGLGVKNKKIAINLNYETLSYLVSNLDTPSVGSNIVLSATYWFK